MKQRLYKDECIECKQAKLSMSLCHIWNLVYCDGDAEDCKNPELTDKGLDALIAKGGKIPQ